MAEQHRAWLTAKDNNDLLGISGLGLDDTDALRSKYIIGGMGDNVDTHSHSVHHEVQKQQQRTESQRRVQNYRAQQQDNSLANSMYGLWRHNAPVLAAVENVLFSPINTVSWGAHFENEFVNEVTPVAWLQKYGEKVGEKYPYLRTLTKELNEATLDVAKQVKALERFTKDFKTVQLLARERQVLGGFAGVAAKSEVKTFAAGTLGAVGKGIGYVEWGQATMDVMEAPDNEKKWVALRQYGAIAAGRFIAALDIGITLPSDIVPGAALINFSTAVVLNAAVETGWKISIDFLHDHSAEADDKWYKNKFEK